MLAKEVSVATVLCRWLQLNQGRELGLDVPLHWEPKNHHHQLGSVLQSLVDDVDGSVPKVIDVFVSISDENHLKLKILMRLEIGYEIHSHLQHKVRKPITRCIQDDPITHSYLCNGS